jgi:hypothetical protein
MFRRRGGLVEVLRSMVRAIKMTPVAKVFPGRCGNCRSGGTIKVSRSGGISSSPMEGWSDCLCLDNAARKKRRNTMEKKNANLDINVEPVSDQILDTVLGGIGDEDGISNSCSTSGCSNSTKTT